MQEVWKDIPGYEGAYQVSDLGRVKSLAVSVVNGYHKGKPSRMINSERILKAGTSNKFGHQYVNLRKNKKSHRWYVHRLVMLAFKSECPEGKVVCHNDGNPRNNQLSNLRFDTKSENTREIYKHGRKSGTGILSIEQVKNIKTLSNNSLMSNREIADKLGVKRRLVERVRSGETFKWVEVP